MKGNRPRVQECAMSGRPLPRTAPGQETASGNGTLWPPSRASPIGGGTAGEPFQDGLSPPFRGLSRPRACALSRGALPRGHDGPDPARGNWGDGWWEEAGVTCLPDVITRRPRGADGFTGTRAWEQPSGGPGPRRAEPRRAEGGREGQPGPLEACVSPRKSRPRSRPPARPEWLGG